MSTRVLRSDEDRAAAMTWLRHVALPCTMSIAKGTRRTEHQNRTQRLWCNEAAEQLEGHTAEELRGHCKLDFGVRILYDDDADFRERWDEVMGPLDYETKLKLMMVPFDFPVTRLMTTHQKARYLTEIRDHFTSLGCVLTDPDKRKRKR